MDQTTFPDAVEPTEWFVLFHVNGGPSRFFNFLALGRFKHVSAVGYCPGFKVWLVCDAQWSALRLTLHSHDAMLKSFAEQSRGCAVVKIKRGEKPMRLASRVGFYCVPTIKHLIGFRGSALRPDALYRQLLRNGGLLIDAEHSADPGRSEPRG